VRGEVVEVRYYGVAGFVGVDEVGCLAWGVLLLVVGYIYVRKGGEVG
jgi:hypothetical protein